jgi:hypothetical protein
MKRKPVKRVKRPDKPKDDYKASMEKVLFLNKGESCERRK